MKSSSSAQLILALLLIGAGTVVLVTNLDLLPYPVWHRYWPVLLIAAGLADVLRSGSQKRPTL